MLTEMSHRDVTEHIATQNHAMAGATIASSAALGCSLGEACVRITGDQLGWERAARTRELARRLGEMRLGLLALADEDSDAITVFARQRDAGRGLQGQELLCEMPFKMGTMATDAASILQDFRRDVLVVQDDLEIAITLLTAAARGAILLLDSNLRLWPEPDLLERFEQLLSALREHVSHLQPVERVRPASDSHA